MLGALISAGASLLGGVLGRKDAQKREDRNLARQEALQREFAQNGIQWRAEDARKAGISPIYAMGAPTTSYSPISVGGGDGGLAGSISQAGSDIGRAIDATRSTTERVDAFTGTLRRLQLEGLSLDNDVKRAELLSKMQTVKQAGSGPGMPSDLAEPFIPGTSVFPEWAKPANRLAYASEGKPESEYGLSPNVKWYRSKTGWQPQVPSELAESFEGEPWPNPSAISWYMANKVLPMVNESDYNPPFPAPPGKYWYYDFARNEYQLHEGGLGGLRRRFNR